MKKKHSTVSYFYQFILFNLCFFGLQIALLSSSASGFMSAVKLPVTVWLELFATLCIHLVAYTLLSMIQTTLLLGVLKRPWHYFSGETWLLSIWGLTLCAALSANGYYFPLSVFSKLFSPPIPPSFIFVLMIISVFALIVLVINSLLSRRGLYIIITAIPILLLYTFWSRNEPIIQYSKTDKPNIIILGIDSLSPTSINSKNMPFFSQLLNNSTQFTNSISPLARTYPAWSSILTGLYEKHHHAEENLVPVSMVKSQASILWILKEQGYTNIFATDDRRFNSLNTDFGLKKVIGPKIGVNDILIGSFNDFPITNLIINFPISSWLFPYNYSNRAGFYSYYPQTFNTKLIDDLTPEAQNPPFFLAVHFEIPHWPYAWAESLPEQVNNEFSLEKRNVLYQQALRRVDTQFKDFFMYLQDHHYLDNCLLVLLSDHGEVLYYPNSRLTNYHNYKGKLPSRFAEYLENKTATVLNKSAGHGSDILSPGQYDNVLAFRIYKNGQITTRDARINTRIALIDLAPTILDFLHLESKQKMDGISLLPAIINPKHTLPERTFFIESGIFPNQLLSKNKAMEIGKEFYTVNPNTGEIEMNVDKLKYFNDQKLYGIIEGDWILALYPDDKTYIAVIQNLTTGAWIDDLHSEFAKSTPADRMYKEMHRFYGSRLYLPLP
jgi:hypothetical protein